VALGHDVRLIPPKYVKPFVKRNKNDAADAEAIVEAVLRPSMRFVPVKSEEQQSMLMLHRARNLLTRQETSLINAIRGHFAEFGIIEAAGAHRVKRLIAQLDDPELAIPELARGVLVLLARQLAATEQGLAEINRRIRAVHAQSEVCRRLETIPGIGPVVATAMAATVPQPAEFRSGRVDEDSRVRLPSGPAVCVDRINEAGHMTASDQHPDCDFSLARRGPSTHADSVLRARRGPWVLRRVDGVALAQPL
jgi:transposase